jgi:DNA processing protein
MNRDLPFLVALTQAPGIGPAKTKVLLDFFKSAEAVWKSNDHDLAQILGKADFDRFLDYKKKTDVEINFEGLSRSGIEVISLLEDSYPKLLRQISQAPPILYYRGDFLSISSSPCIAVVGTRTVTLYGREVTERITEGLALAGLTVVSGLARGVDTVAHEATLGVGGKTIAVLGSGLNRIYPVQNSSLAQKIIASGGAVVTEYPPEMESIPQNFPARNRIISGLSLGVVVTEAAEDSGSLITADFAAEQNREVFAVPGPITSKLSRGPSKLLKVGAKLVSGVEDILEELKVGVSGTEKGQKVFQPSSIYEEKVWQAIEDSAKSIDQIVRESGLDASTVSSTLTMLEIHGHIRHLGTGVYARK